MLWQENTDSNRFIVPDDIVDLSFRIRCRELPVDHAWALYHAIQARLPWIEKESNIGIHSIHGAASGNGWTRPPEQEGSMLQLSRRTRLYLRIPKERLDETMTLCGSTLDLSDYQIEIGEGQIKPLVPNNTVFSRSVCGDDVEDEEKFTREIVKALERQNIRVTKMLCGLSHIIKTPKGDIPARSVLFADLQLPESIHLQQYGLGPGRTLGCGIFLPHKSLAAVRESQNDD